MLTLAEKGKTEPSPPTLYLRRARKHIFFMFPKIQKVLFHEIFSKQNRKLKLLEPLYLVPQDSSANSLTTKKV